MILFQDDWLQYETAVIHYETTNKSFLNYSLLLKAMGVKNHLFPLALIHSELKGVDPFSETLTTEQQVLIAIESRINPWYFFREVARVPGSTLANPIRYNANRSNICLFWLYFNHITTCLLQIRQTGKTLACSILDNYLLNVGTDGGRTVLLTKDEGLRSKTLSEIKTLIELLPPYLKQHHKNDIGNKEEIVISSFDNNYKGLIARNDPIAADKTGRGLTVESIRVDEAAYLFYIQIALAALLPVTTAARAKAQLRNKPYGNIFTTTAGKKDDRDGSYMYEFFNSSAPWTEFFFDAKNEEELKTAIRASSRDGKNLRVHAAFNHRQLGYTDQWLEETARENNSFGEAYQRDYLNIWTSGSQNSPFTPEMSKLIRESVKEIQFAQISRFAGITMRWYIKEQDIARVMNNNYTVISVDTSDGMGRDEFSILIRHLKTGEVLAVTSVNSINLITVANFLVDLLKTFLNATMIIERRNQAAALIDYMHQQMLAIGMDPFKRLFNFVVQDHIEFPERYKEIQNSHNVRNEHFLAQYKKFFGFITSGGGVTSRSELFGTTLQAAVKYTGHLMNDKPTIDQTLSLIIKNGRIDHPVGGHDDLVVGWLLSYWFMTFGRNLQYYGIPANYVFSSNTVINSSLNKEEIYQAERTKSARAYIDNVMNRIKNEKDSNVIERLMMDIENVQYALGPQHEVSLSVDQMLTDLKKNKQTASYEKRSIFG